MNNKLFKRLTAAALALLMVAASVPSGSDFSQLFTGSSITASAVDYNETGEIILGGAKFKFNYVKIDSEGTKKYLQLSPVDEKQYWFSNVAEITINTDDIFNALKNENAGTSGTVLYTELNYRFNNIRYGNDIYYSRLCRVKFKGKKHIKIGDSMFASINNLQTVDFGGVVDYIGDSAFNNCPNFKGASGSGNVMNLEGVKEIGNSAFSNCKTVTGFKLNDSLIFIGDHAFDGCKGLSTITIPSTVTSIGEMAFGECQNLSDIYLSSDPSGLTWNADQNESGNFKPNKGTKCHVPAEYLSSYVAKFAKGEDTDINVSFVGFGKCGDNAIWELDEKTGKLTISGTGDMRNFSSEDAPWYCLGSAVKEIEIGSDITRIGMYAFRDLTNVSKVTFGENSKLTTIGAHSFKRCEKIGSSALVIPASVKIIEASAFQGAFNYADGINTVSFERGSKLITIGDDAFHDCKTLNSIELPEGLTTIGDYAFIGCMKLSTITIPSTVTSIGAIAFVACYSLTDVYMSADPSKLTWTVNSFEDKNFIENKGTKCHVPVEYLSAYKAKFAKGEDTDINVTFVCEGKCGDNAYWSYNAVNKVLTISGSGAMYDYTSNDKIPWYSIRSEIAELDISNGITHIGNRSFYGLDNESFTSVFIPAGVESIGSSAFCGCSRVSSISFSENSKLRAIGEYAFNSCTDLSMLCLPEGLTSVKDYAFDNCVSISMIVMPGSISEIGDGAFMHCNNVYSIYFTSAPDFSWSWKETAVDGYFRPNKGTECFVPGKYISAYKEKFGATANATITAENLCGDTAYWEWDEESGKLTIGGTGAMYDYNNTMKKAPWYELNQEIKSVEIGSDITKIGIYAFNDCGKIASVTFGKNSKLTSIGDGAFRGCSSLASMIVPSKVTQIGECAFYECRSLSPLTLPEGLKAIGAYALFDCGKLTSVTIPSTVTSIGETVFYGCIGISDVYMSSDPSELTWAVNNATEGGNFKPNKATKCHVPKQYYSAYKAKFAKGANTDVNVTFVSDDCKVTVAKTTNGTVTANKSSGQSGETITLTVKPNTGYKLKSLTVKDSAGKTVTVTSNKFTLPASDVTVTAVFEKQTYTIKFVNGSETLQTLTVAYGDTPKYTGTTPTKAKTAQYTYTFKGWTPDIKAATADATYTATFTNTTNKYTLTLPKNMTVVGTAAASYEYGTVVKFEADSGYSVIKQVRNGSTVLTPTNGVYSVTITANTTVTAVTGKKVAEKRATCTAAGNIAYYEGSDGKLYDKNGKVITKEQTVIKATGHKYTAKWTWTKNKVTGGYSCKADIKCGKCNASKNNIAAQITEKSSSKEICGKKRTVKYIAKVTYGGKTFTVNKTVIVTVSHNYSDWETTSFNVNDRTSVQKRTCSVCKKTESKTVKNSVVRFAGNDRAQTAALISNSAKHGMYKTADTVVIATGFDFHDALAAVPLASAYDAPLLLADRDNLSQTTINEIKRLQAKKVIVVATTNAKDNNGNEAAIGAKVYKQLKELRVGVIKLTGKDYYETAEKVAKKLVQKTKNEPTEIFVTTDKNYADALTVAPIAAVKGAPIFYVGDKLKAKTRTLLKKYEYSVKNVYIVGGTNAVSKGVEDSLKKNLKRASVTRYAGDDRYDTAIKINNAFSSVFKGKSLCITTGQNFPDALAGGVYAAKELSPMLLVNGAQTKLTLTNQQKSYLKLRKIDKIVIFGGKTAVSDSIVKTIAKASVK